MEYVVSLMLILVGVIHLLPLIGVLGNSKLTSLYGLTINEPNLSILMRHRAVLFGILGAFFVYAAFAPQYQLIALIAALLSVVSFLYLTYIVGEYNQYIRRVVIADILALLCLAIGFIAYGLLSVAIHQTL